MTPPARLVLVRHGQIDANVQQIWHGSTDSSLTVRGREQAAQVAAHLGAERPTAVAVYTSPLERTQHTAAPIAHALGHPVAPDPDLVEFGIGELEGESYAALLSEHRFFERIFRDPAYAPPGGESMLGVIARMRRALSRIAARHAGEEVVVVGHGAALGLALADLLESKPISWRRYHLRNASVSELVLEPEPALLSFDAVEHLED